MSEAIQEPLTQGMSYHELWATMANGSIASQIRCTETELADARTLSPSQGRMLMGELTDRIAALERQYDDPNSQTWQRYKDYALGPPRSSPEAIDGAINGSEPKLKSAVQIIAGLITQLTAEQDESLYLVGDALEDLFEAYNTAVDRIEQTSQVQQEPTEAYVALIAVPDANEATEPATLEVDGIYTSDSDHGAVQLLTMPLEASIAPMSEAVLKIPEDLDTWLRTCLIRGYANYKDILVEVFECPTPNVAQIKAVLEILNTRVEQGMVVRDKRLNYRLVSGRQSAVPVKFRSQGALAYEKTGIKDTAPSQKKSGHRIHRQS